MHYNTTYAQNEINNIKKRQVTHFLQKYTRSYINISKINKNNKNKREYEPLETSGSFSSKIDKELHLHKKNK